MKVLAHHIYEYKKGLRQLILHTLHSKYRFAAETRLRLAGIDFLTFQVTPEKINIFFGSKECIEVIKHIGDKSFYDYSPEEDFILGVLLGYDKIQQCNRYLRLCEKQKMVKTAT
ncbi:MAG: DUF2023 family protein [Salinivirgaceae bacterium]|nr:DUF2023 family protein [Salinivirgaceae bacterium]